jgi:hypothetical protein
VTLRAYPAIGDIKAVGHVCSWPEAADLSAAATGSFLGNTGRAANVAAKAAHDPKRTNEFYQQHGSALAGSNPSSRISSASS